MLSKEKVLTYNSRVIIQCINLENRYFHTQSLCNSNTALTIKLAVSMGTDMGRFTFFFYVKHHALNQSDKDNSDISIIT